MAELPLQALFQRLWDDFTQVNPQADAIHQLLESRGESIVNDHVAFRTLSDPRVNIDVIARPFLEAGYVERGEYAFDTKKLDARHYEHPAANSPKVFISELRIHDFSPDLQKTLRELVDQISSKTLNDPQLCAEGRPWILGYSEYEALAAESEYAGWMAAFGFRANHFTVLVNALRSVSSLAELNELIRQAGFPLNSEGGEIKGSPEVFLEQSSTLASQTEVRFRDGVHRIPGCYYEFARRYPLPDGRLFGGFVAKSADKIFQSTDRAATGHSA
jgi:hypothetical protein